MLEYLVKDKESAELKEDKGGKDTAGIIEYLPKDTLTII